MVCATLAFASALFSGPRMNNTNMADDTNATNVPPKRNALGLERNRSTCDIHCDSKRLSPDKRDLDSSGPASPTLFRVSLIQNGTRTARLAPVSIHPARKNSTRSLQE